MKTNFGHWAIVAVSRDATTLGLRVKGVLEEWPATVYTLSKYCTDETQAIAGPMADFFGSIMAQYDTILCIMATGIVVRSIAPHLGHKSTDPAILVMDAAGKYVISLVSGHLGGANEAAVMLAGRLDASPVITTGTDVKGSLAVDVLAEKLGCTIADFTDAKDVTAAILDDEIVAIEDWTGVDFTGIVLPANILLPGAEGHPEAQWRIVIDDAQSPEKLLPGHSVQLVPKSITVGIGCRRDTPGERIVQELTKLLNAVGYHQGAVKTLATIPLKADEPGIRETSERLGADVKIISDDFVKMVQSRFEGSDFVEKTTGLRSVSEPCGYVASGFGHCVAPVVKCGGITLSLWKKKK